jgi:hypothetical protein
VYDLSSKVTSQQHQTSAAQPQVLGTREIAWLARVFCRSPSERDCPEEFWGTLSLSGVCFRLKSEGSRKQTLQEMETTVMKTNRFNSIFSSAILSSAIAMGLLVSTGSVQAQNSPKGTANIPFAFQAGSRQMPAGVYDISLLSDHVVLLQSLGANASAFLIVTPSDEGTVQMNSRLVFHQYGELYFLSAVWEAGTKHGVTCAATSKEKEILRAQNKQAPNQTQVALNAGPK